MTFRPGHARIAVIALLVVLWEVLVRAFGDPLFLSPPSRVLPALADLYRDAKVDHAVLVTLWELWVAFLLSVAIGLALGLVVGLHRFSRGSIYPIVLLLYAIPQSTLLPVFVLVFGIGPASKIAFGVSHGFFPVVLAVAAGVQNIPPALLRSARAMGANRRQILLSVVFPHMVPSFFTGMRLAMAAVLLGVLLAELYVSQVGIGFYTRAFTDGFEPAKLFALIAVLAAIAVVLNELCRRAERHFSRWRQA